MTSNPRQGVIVMMVRPVVGAGAIVALLTAAGPGVASAAPSPRTVETNLSTWQNDDRAERGIGSLRTSTLLVRIARAHADRMAKAHDVWHEEDLASLVGDWRALGDNVGRGETADAIHDAFLASGPHRANILDPAYELVGVGAAASDDGQVYVAVIFLKPAPVARKINCPSLTTRWQTPQPVRPRLDARRRLHPINESPPTETISMLVALSEISSGENGIEPRHSKMRRIS